jgi:hypothetical protein
VIDCYRTVNRIHNGAVLGVLCEMAVGNDRGRWSGGMDEVVVVCVCCVCKYKAGGGPYG